MTMQQRKFRSTFLATLLTGLLIACLTVPALADVNARLERNKVYEGDPVILIIESDGRQPGEPDLAALDKDFRVLGSSTSTQVSIINGRRSDKTSWTVQLEPLHKGTLRIPPINVGSEQTRALELEVTDIPEQVAARQSAHVFIEVETDTDGKSLYVQQQIHYTVRLYFDEQILNGELQAPQPDQTVVEQLGEDKQSPVTRNGQRYNVIERRYAIAPQKSGPLRLPPLSFKGQMVAAADPATQGSRQQQLFQRLFRDSPFANDSFLSNTPFTTRSQPVRTRSKAINLDIQPLPASAGSNWLPAERLSLQDSWIDSPPQFRAGEPVTRTITLQAMGLSGTQLPALPIEQPEQARLYPEAPLNESRTDGKKVYGISKQSFTYIPSRAGKLTIPALELNWWNTTTNQAARTRLPPWTFNVEPGSDNIQNASTAMPENAIATSAAEEPAADSRKTDTSRFAQLLAFARWPFAAGTLLLLSIILLAAKQRRKAMPARSSVRQELPATQKDTRATIKYLLPQLQHACMAADAQTAAQTLLEVGRARWPNDPPRNLGALASRLGNGYAQIMTLDRALYAADTAEWNGADLYIAVKDAWHSKPTEKKTVEGNLKPLYPL